MKTLLKIEEFAMLLLSLLLFSSLGFSWWVYAALFLAPDLGMVGYLINNSIGAWSYNLLHHKGLAVLIYALGYYSSEPKVQLIGLILFGHASFDRMLGYGLKYSNSFNDTHLGRIGKQ